MIKNRSVTFTIAIIFLTSLACVYRYLLVGGILASGESFFYLNPHFTDYFYTWSDKFNFGSNYPHQSNLVLFGILWKVLEVFSRLVHPSVMFLFLSLFLSSLFFYLVARKLTNLEDELIYIPACALYTFNLFRILGPLNERLNLLFIFLPLYFYFYERFLKTNRFYYLSILLILAILSSSLGANLPLFTIPYILMLMQFAFYVLSTRLLKSAISRLFKTLGFFVLVLMANLFWMLPMSAHLLAMRSTVMNGGLPTFWSAGSFFDFFRLLGAWSWRAGYYVRYYYPFASNYYYPVLLISSYFVTSCAFVFLFFPRTTKNNYYTKFFSIVFFVAIFLSAGIIGPFGEFFKKLFLNIPLLAMYREPFAKFMPLVIFSLAYLLLFSLDSIYNKFSSKFTVRFPNSFLSIK